MSVRVLAVRAPNWVGDLVMATPMLEALARDARFEQVHVLLRAPLADVLRGGPLETRLSLLHDGREELQRYRELRPDAVLLLSNSIGAAWRAWRARVPLRIGSALSGRRWLLTSSFVPPTRDGRRMPTPTAHLLRDAVGLLGVTVESLHPRLWIRPEEERGAREAFRAAGLDPDRGYVLCCPGAAFGAAKLWPPERFAAALDALHQERGWRAWITGAPSEAALVEAVRSACKHAAAVPAREHRGLGLLKVYAREARLMLVGDSGPRWYAAAFDLPCVSVMGPNFPELTASSLELCEVVRRDDLECAPCLERVCPLGHHRCMRELSVERVLAAARRVLSLRSPSPRSP